MYHLLQWEFYMFKRKNFSIIIKYILYWKNNSTRELFRYRGTEYTQCIFLD